MPFAHGFLEWIEAGQPDTAVVEVNHNPTS